MNDVPYEEHLLRHPHREIMGQLRKEFPNCQLWVRFENFQRSISGALVDTKSGAATVVSFVRPKSVRTSPLTRDELDRIRTHVAEGNAEQDLEI